MKRMAELRRVQRNLRSIGYGLLPGALALGVDLWGLSPGGMGILVSSTILSLTWWIAVPFGMVIASTLSRRTWTALLVGAIEALMFHVLIVMSRPAAERAGALFSPSYLFGALGTMLLPWLIGALLGWASTVKQPVHHDGVPRNEER